MLQTLVFPLIFLLLEAKSGDRARENKNFTVCLLVYSHLLSPLLDYAMLQEAIRRGQLDMRAVVSSATLKQYITMVNFWSILKLNRGYQ